MKVITSKIEKFIYLEFYNLYRARDKIIIDGVQRLRAYLAD